MSTKRRTVLQRMDALVRWSNASDQVRHDMSGTDERRHRPMRWLPLLPVAFGAGLVFCATAFSVPFGVYGATAGITTLGTIVSVNGPMGKSSIDDDEREAALRKNAFLFTLALLALANIVAGPALLVTAALKGWAVERAGGVAFALVIGNLAWFASLPTLYASWKLPRLSDDDS